MGSRRVIIDDGVYTRALKIPHIDEHLQVENDGSIVQDCNEPNPISHGTKCAAIIEELHPNQTFTSIRVLGKSGKGQIENLIRALNWCRKPDVKLIHMSIGPACYPDAKAIEDAIIPLIERDVLLVSAYHNLNVPTWPALCQGVFGVHYDRTGVSGDACFSFDNAGGLLPDTNALVSRFKGPLYDLQKNPFSTKTLANCPSMDVLVSR